MLNENERLDDLEYNGLKLIQYKDGYCFNSDSVLLSNIVKLKSKDIVCDLGAGSGIISILLSAKNNPKSIYSFEIQERYYSLLKRNIQLNNLTNITPLLMDMKEGCKIYNGIFDVVVTNPPYGKAEGGIISENEELAIARHEIKITLDELVSCSNKFLKFGGYMYVIYKSKRLIELINSMLKYNLAPKEIITIEPKQGVEIDTVIVVAKKGGSIKNLKMKNILCFNEDNTYTNYVKKLYNKD